jgi:hypothetical protein
MFIAGFAFLGPFGLFPSDGSRLLFTLSVIALYLGASILANVFPAVCDAKELWSSVKNSRSVLLKIIGYPMAVTAMAGAYLETCGVNALLIFGLTAKYFIKYVFGTV